jgi:hypothetical protein
VGYVIGVAGAVIATGAVITRSLPLLLLGTVLIGFGNSSNQLSRYVAADLFPDARRASAIGLVVWGATFGAVVGPNLIAWADSVAKGLGFPTLAGGYLLPTSCRMRPSISFACSGRIPTSWPRSGHGPAHR